MSGIITAILLLLFLGMCVWAFSPRRKRDFDAAAQLPLSDDPQAMDEKSRAPQQENDR